MNLGIQFSYSDIWAFKRQFEYTKAHTLQQLKGGFLTNKHILHTLKLKHEIS